MTRRRAREQLTRQQQQQQAAQQAAQQSNQTIGGANVPVLNSDMPSVDRRAFQPPGGNVGPNVGPVPFGNHGPNIGHMQSGHQIHPAMLPHQHVSSGPQHPPHHIITHLDQLVSRSHRLKFIV